ncbi:helix-turn-helix domain-containing protein [uncultured Desulfovibrio sp.]|uniref:helix-turn-helix domain-containing protein n=1 Tax=uncultured Desulfovibrio sp. TaxID=167968 RepID=UPI00345C16BD
MERLRARGVRLRPKAGQENLMRHFAGCCRFLRNRASALERESPRAGRWKAHGVFLIRLPKTGWARYRKSRDIKGTPRQATVPSSAGKRHVSIQMERELPDPVHPAGPRQPVEREVPRRPH